MNRLIAKPCVVLVGKPNVGKSTLFNRLSNKRISIAHETPGATRDCIIREADFFGTEVLMADSGGLESHDETHRFKDLIKSRVVDFITNKASLVLFVVSAKDGVSPSDHEIAEMLRRVGKPVLLVINKVDHENNLINAYECVRFGFSDPIMVSAAQHVGLTNLKEKILLALGLKTYEDRPSLKLVVGQEEEEVDEGDEDTPDLPNDKLSICVIGKPNSGKSTFVNAMLNEDRVMVSEIPGTTVDAVDTELTYAGKEICLIDTAGIRRKSAIEEEVEKMAVARALCALDRSLIAILMINGKEGVSEQDQKIAGIISEKKKACIIAVNQWDEDLKADAKKDVFLDKLRFELPFLTYVPVVFLSAKYGYQLFDAFDLALKLAPRYQRRTNTSKLNRSLEKAVSLHQPPMHMGRRPKMNFITQIDHSPPTFVISCSRPKDIDVSYKRYLANFFRDDLDLGAVPLRLIFRDKTDREPFNRHVTA
jgi:GTPase